MCLESITRKPKKHKVGYKICSKEDDHFSGQVYDAGPYHIGKTYDAKFGSEDLPDVVSDVSSKGTTTYLAGFHYYLKMKDATNLCGRNEVVIRIKVDNILATGIQNDFDAGVAEFMTLDKVVFDGDADLFKRFLKICNGTVQNRILKFAKQFHDVITIPANALKEMADFVTDSDDHFLSFISFVDCFPRQSHCFKMYTKIHLWALKNHPEYKRYYHYIVRNQNNFSDRLRVKNYTEMVRMTMEIDDFVLNHI